MINDWRNVFFLKKVSASAMQTLSYTLMSQIRAVDNVTRSMSCIGVFWHCFSILFTCNCRFDSITSHSDEYRNCVCTYIWSFNINISVLIFVLVMDRHMRLRCHVMQWLMHESILIFRHLSFVYFAKYISLFYFDTLLIIFLVCGLSIEIHPSWIGIEWNSCSFGNSNHNRFVVYFSVFVE